MVGITQALEAYASYESFLISWDDKDFFNAGFFMGKGAVEAVVLSYVLLLALSSQKTEEASLAQALSGQLWLV